MGDQGDGKGNGTGRGRGVGDTGRAVGRGRRAEIPAGAGTGSGPPPGSAAPPALGGRLGSAAGTPREAGRGSPALGLFHLRPEEEEEGPGLLLHLI